MNKEKALKNQGLEFREDIQVGGENHCYGEGFIPELRYNIIG